MASSDPLDLARWRALVSDTERVILTACADIIERQGDGAVRYIGARVDEVREPLTALATALRAACDEVERLRGDVANASTAERARLAGMASEEDRAMMESVFPACGKRRLYERWKDSLNPELALAAKMCTPDYPCSDCLLTEATKTTLLATLAARRAAAVEEALTWAAGAVCLGCSNGLEYRSGWHYTDELLAARQEGGSPCEAEAIRDRIRALSASPASGASIPGAGPDKEVGSE